MKLQNLIKTGVLAALLLSSCRKLVQDEFTSPPAVPALNALLKQGEPMEVLLSYPASINAAHFETIDDATIALYANHEFTENLEFVSEGKYQSSFLLEENTIYACEVFVPGYDTLRCIDTVPARPKVSNIEHIDHAGRNAEGTVYPAVKITFTNDTSTRQYYEVYFTYFMSDTEYPAMLEEITDPLLINEGLPIALFSNTLIKDTRYQLYLNYTTGGASKVNGIWYTMLYPVIVQFRQVSYAYYQYARSMYLYDAGRYPDGLDAQTTVFNTWSNIDGGDGIFAAFSAFQSDTIYPDSNYDQ